MRIAICFLPASISLAGSASGGPDLWLTRKGDMLFSESFSSPSLDTNRWTVSKGQWEIKDGALTGREVESDRHAAAIRTAVPFENAVLQFDFRLDGSSGFSLSVNEEKGHHSRVLVTPDGISLVKDRDKKDPKSLSLPLARQNRPFKPGVWHTMIIEYSGNDLLAHTDKQTFVLGTHPQMGSAKINFGFPVRGESASFDNIMVWAATPKPDTAALKQKLLAQQALRNSLPSDPRAASTELETRLRDQLMQSDPTFSGLVDERISIDNELRKRWPKAFQKNAAAQTLRKKLLSEDDDFKALNAKLARARRAELDYLLNQSSELAQLRKAMLSSPTSP